MPAPNCHCEGAQQPWQSLALGGVDDVSSQRLRIPGGLLRLLFGVKGGGTLRPAQDEAPPTAPWQRALPSALPFSDERRGVRFVGVLFRACPSARLPVCSSLAEVP